jgi:hypothetical protein
VPILIIILLGLLFFMPLFLQPDAVLYSDYSDFINYHIPVKRFLVRSVQQTGELPLWCPEMFAGMPFVHDPQVSAFYPLHFPLYFVPEQHLGAACSWIIVLHVILAGLCMYAYARHQGLAGTGALVAALGYMFAGKWLLHMLIGGHFNVAPLAWLPLLLLFLEQAIQRVSLIRASAAGVLVALIILGTHPQFTFYTGLFVGGWSLVNALPDIKGWEPGSRLPRPQLRVVLRRWMGMNAWTALLAGLLCAVQILPALEATRLSSRTLGVPLTGEALWNGVESLVGFIGPSMLTGSGWLWENRGGFCLLWIITAILAPVLAPSRKLSLQVGLALLWAFLGLGGIVVLQWLPGFHLWRLPSRMLMFLSLPVSLFAGTTVQALVTLASVEQRDICRPVLVKLSCFILIPLALFAVLQNLKGEELRLSIYWLSLFLTLPMAWWLLRPLPVKAYPALWILVLVIDLWALGWPLVVVRAEQDVFAPSACISYLAERAGDRGRILDISHVDPADPNNTKKSAPACATPLWPNFAMVAGVEQVRGYNPLDVLRYKEYLNFLKAGQAEQSNAHLPLKPVDGLTLPGPGGFPINSQPLANLLGIRYLLLPSDVPLAFFVNDPAGSREVWNKTMEDPVPQAYSFVPRTDGSDAGIVRLPPYTLYENSQASPRAFVASEAAPLPERDQLLEVFKKTDFRKRVLLEGFGSEVVRPPGNLSRSPVAEIKDYGANRVTVEVNSQAPGWLVLTDIWYPGWTCAVDAQPARIYRANFLFRAVEVPAGIHEVVFTFAPRSYEIGMAISLAAIAVLALGLLIVAVRRALLLRSVAQQSEPAVEPK